MFTWSCQRESLFCFVFLSRYRWLQHTLQTKQMWIWISIESSVEQTDAYLKGILAADVVLRSHRWNDIAGQRNTAQDRFLSAVWRERERKCRREREGGREEIIRVRKVRKGTREIWRKGKSKRINITHHLLISSLPAISITTLKCTLTHTQMPSFIPWCGAKQ